MEPLVSVIIAAYNTGAMLTETVESALAQTWPRREIIVVDDGSTEDLRARLVPYGRAVSYIRQNNAGAGAARNAGLRAAAGDYIAFLDHDDLWLPEKLAVQLAVAARHPESGLIVCDGEQFDGETVLAPRLIGGALGQRLAAVPDGEITGRFHREFIRWSLVACPAQDLIPRHVVDRIGPLTTIRGEASDFDYHLRIALAYPVTFHQDRLVRWRYLASSVSGPQERRSVEWATRMTAVLSRHRARCPAEDRSLLMARFRSIAREAARGACDYGWRRDRGYARSRLGKLLRLAPWESRAALYLIVLSFPAWLIAALVHGRRRLRTFWRPRGRPLER